jgi:hypothetical protein
MKKRLILLTAFLSTFVAWQASDASSVLSKPTQFHLIKESKDIAQAIPRQKQVANDNKGLSLELQACQKSAKKVICSLLITNRRDADTEIELRDPSFYNNAQYVSQVIDSSGEQYLTDEVQIGGKSTSSNKPYFYFKLVRGVPTKLKVSFKVPPKIESFSLLEITYDIYDQQPGVFGNGHVSVQFRNVSIK